MVFFSDEIRFLESKLLALEEKYGDVKKLTATAVAKSEAVSKEALGLLILDSTLPEVNVTELQNRIDLINQEVYLFLNFISRKYFKAIHLKYQ